MNIKNPGGNGGRIPINVPIIGEQPNIPVLQGSVACDPAIIPVIEKWAKTTGLAPGEVVGTIFRLGLITFSVMAGDAPPMDGNDATKYMPLTDNEKKAFGDKNIQ